jgi:hypothetical protein
MPRATVDLHLRFDADISGDLLAALLIREQKRTTTGKPPAGNGAGDGTAPRQQPTEPELRAVLADMASVHPQKVAAVVSLLRTVGGSARLLDCPQDKWLAIEDAARAVLAELRPVS